METTYDGGGISSIFAIFGIGYFIFMLALSVFSIIVHWKVFEKAGQPGWAIFVPIYNFIVYLRIIGKPWTWVFLVFTPAVIVGAFIVWINGSMAMARSFGKDTMFGLGLMFLAPVFYAIIAFDKTIQYVGPNGIPTEDLDSQIGSIGKPAL
ncbi:DUF5684 domain-containing protein [[Flexibacter] sp. ATCC 35208]|uniref:DUF5684 domain-containing protein n=1 Tax=[Flexibacter] sp. ATCC 35208 TaxID=1936242 RepID=UPI0009D3EC40|nr:DUF5684 domain-containing protein [[Flexibacter] sp. ATCC 35208]OMP80538.1 hypothetical protein BW716_03260 [[Flexibacter] sp. ATCC 35208]